MVDVCFGDAQRSIAIVTQLIQRRALFALFSHRSPQRYALCCHDNDCRLMSFACRQQQLLAPLHPQVVGLQQFLVLGLVFSETGVSRRRSEPSCVCSSFGVVAALSCARALAALVRRACVAAGRQTMQSRPAADLVARRRVGRSIVVAPRHHSLCAAAVARDARADERTRARRRRRHCQHGPNFESCANSASCSFLVVAQHRRRIVVVAGASLVALCHISSSSAWSRR